MNAMKSTLACATLALTAAGSLVADDDAVTFVEEFDNGSNEGNWTYGLPQIEIIQDQGGNPLWWLHSSCPDPNDCLTTFAPQLRTTPLGGQSVFTGNYAARGVTSLGIDLQTLAAQNTAGRPLTIMLINDHGTPNDPNDATAAFYLGDNIPAVGQGWKKFDFDIPSHETELPEGWALLNMASQFLEPERSWNEIIEDVSQVLYFYGNPLMDFIFQQWELGVDNPRMTYTDMDDPVPGDLNGDGVVGVADLLILLSLWGECVDCGDCLADLTGSCTVGVSDLLILLENWG